MRLPQFRAMVERMTAEIPVEYLDGIAAVEVSRKMVPHPTRAHVFTLGECVPLDTGPEHVGSRVVLHYGSFRELARERSDFDWRQEAWETLMHELRHHLEWRAGSPALEAYDWAAEQNFAREEGDAFDPMFYRSGEAADQGVYRVDDDFFLERVVTRPPSVVEVGWHGRRYRVKLPQVGLPLFVALDGIEPPPPGEAVLVVRRKPRLRDLFRRAPVPFHARARVDPIE